MRYRTAAILAAVSSVASAQRGSGAATPEVIISLRPLRNGGPEVVALAVRAEARAIGAAASRSFRVSTPITYAGVRNIADRVDSLVLRDASGIVPLTIQDDASNPGGFPYYRHWRATRAVVAPVVLTYRMRPFAGTQRPGPQFDFYAHAGGISSGGMALLVLPESLGVVRARVHWDLGDLASGSTAATTFGDGDFELRGSVENLAQGFYAAGPLGHFTTGSSSGLRAYWLGQPQFDPRQEMSWAADAHAYFKKFYRDTTTSTYRIFIRAIPGVPRLGGTALGRSFMLGVTAGSGDPNVTSPREMIAHEMGHMWVGGLAGGGEGAGATWFTEGLNVYYTRLLLLRSGLDSVVAYERSVNSSASAYYSSPFRNASADSLGKLGFSVGVGAGSAQNVPYQRGSLFFADIDEKIRSASGGRHTLDDIMLPLFERRARGDRLDEQMLLDALAKELGSKVREQFDAVIVHGATLDVAAGAFGPCFDRRAVHATAAGPQGYEWTRVAGVADETCRKW